MGPTALGKTAVAVELAAALGGEIVTADSMQVYAGLRVVTNQPGPLELRRVPHHLVGFVDPHTDYSVAEYVRAAHEVIDTLRHAGVPVVLEGGSGLYVRAALGGLDFGAAPDPARRARLERRLNDEGVAALYEELARRDPHAAASVDPRNPRRVVRALEQALAGVPGPGERNQLWRPGSRYPYRLFALDEERDLLRRRVEERVPTMIAEGAAEEVRALLAGGPPSRTVAQAIGVRELAEYLAGLASLDQAVAAMQTRTWRFVRRQLTWMRKLPDAGRIRVSGRPAAAVAQEIAGVFRGLP